jgi:hypothetical protein
LSPSPNSPPKLITAYAIVPLALSIINRSILPIFSRYAAVPGCLQFGRSQLADDWTLAELQSWLPPLAISRGGLTQRIT